jgi:5-methylcytosine-specific restriction endonuclease McrA
MRALLLNSAYQGLGFISWKRAIKLIIKGRADLVSTWDQDIGYGSGSMKYPAVVRLNKYIPRHIKKRRYNRVGVFRRDKYTCLYCGYKGNHKDLTIDHVVPRDHGGQTTWENCATSCYDCNNVKSNRTPKQAGMRLSRKPFVPSQTIWHEYNLLGNKHPDWKMYVEGFQSNDGFS